MTGQPRCLDCGAEVDEPDESRCQPCRDKVWASELDRRRADPDRRDPPAT